MTAWGTAPARGRFRICGTCGAKLAFVEASRPGGSLEAQHRMLSAIRDHLNSSSRCREAGTFSSGLILACRCERPMPLPREDGLKCARCEALISPEVAAGPAESDSSRRRPRGSR
jgi:hypothetical protein